MISRKIFLLGGSLFLAMLIGAFIWWSSPVWLLLFYMNSQMKAGQRYMDSLTSRDSSSWIERTNYFLKEFDPSDTSFSLQYGSGAKPVPSDLSKLKILGIRITQDCVEYIWLGGMDHTRLEVTKDQHGHFTFTGVYDDLHSKPLLATSTEQDAAANP